MSGGGSARKEINMDNKAYQKMDYALCLLSAAADGKRHGCIVNSFHQVTSSFPPKFTVAVNKDHETCKAIPLPCWVRTRRGRSSTCSATSPAG